MVYGARDPDDVERLIMPKLLKTFPRLSGVKIDYRWTGNFLLTLRDAAPARLTTTSIHARLQHTASPVPNSPVG